MRTIPSAARNGALSTLARRSSPRSTARTIPAAAGVPSSRSASLQRGSQAISPEAPSLRTSSSPVSKSALAAQPEFTSKLEGSAPISPVRCGPPGPPGKSGYDPYETALPFVVMQADDGSLHRLFIKTEPGSDPVKYTTYVEQEPYSM